MRINTPIRQELDFLDGVPFMDSESLQFKELGCLHGMFHKGKAISYFNVKSGKVALVRTPSDGFVKTITDNLDLEAQARGMTTRYFDDAGMELVWAFQEKENGRNDN